MAVGRFPMPGDSGVIGTVMLVVPMPRLGAYLIYVDAFASEWATPDAVRVQAGTYPGATTGNPLRFTAQTVKQWNVGANVFFDVIQQGAGYNATNVR